MFATGTRDNVRSFTIGPEEVAGTLIQPLSADEIIETLLMGIAGGVTPTTPSSGVYLWTFTPSSGVTPLDSAAFEWQDGANPWLISGNYAESIQIKGSANGVADVTTTLFGKGIAATTMTGALSQRTPSIIEGFETRLFLDSIGATPGTTEVDGFLINWDVTIKNNLARKYFAQNTNTLGAVPSGALSIEATLTFEAAVGQAITEFTNWNVAVAAPVERLVRLSFGNNTIIASTYKDFVTVDIPGAWSAIALDQAEANTRVYQMKMQYVYDPTNLYGIQVRAQNGRAAAWV